MTVRESIGGKTGKKAVRYLLEALLLAGIVYLVYALAGIRELLTWTYGVRTFLTGTAVFFLAALSAGKSFLTAFRGVSTALFCCTRCRFPSFQALLPERWASARKRPVPASRWRWVWRLCFFSLWRQGGVFGRRGFPRAFFLFFSFLRRASICWST